MRKIGMDELRQKQMEVLDYVTKFCDENDICYVLVGGTLLGSVRHKGYIPWDDDIDIGMLREDYDRFSEVFPQKCDKIGYIFKSPELDKCWHLPFGKVMDMNTLFVQDGHDLGINIDVFPYDDTPDDPELAARMYKMRDTLKSVNAAQMNRKRPSGNLLRRIAVYCIRFVLHMFPDYYFIHKISTRARKYEGKGYDFFGTFAGESLAPPCEKRIMRERVTSPFEDREYKIPKDYDTWLRAYYGDYMTLPPESQRKRHTYEAFVAEEGEVIRR